MTLSTGARLGPYEIQAAIGAGGMGEVYKARDTRLDRTVAVKVLPAEFSVDPERRKRFEREGKIIAGLEHPHICVLHDIGRESGIDFLVMEYVGGTPLATPQPIAKALEYAIQIADALSAAHQKGVIHRDLKPANVMVTPEGQVKVLDFGLARHVTARDTGDSQAATATVQDIESDLTGIGVAIGTVSYMSPEQVEGKRLDERSDIFSFGAVLHELLTGQRAFQGDSAISTMSAILRDTPVRASKVCADVPQTLDAIVSRCLEKNRDRRYASAADLHQALLQCEAGMRRSTGLRALRYPRTTVALAVLLLASGVAGWRVYQRSARRDWATHEAPAEVAQLTGERKFGDAFRVAEVAERLVPQNPALAALWPRMSRAVTVITAPPGADIYVREYADQTSAWRFLGRSPIEAARIPLQYCRWRIVKQGFETIEAADPSPLAGAVVSTPLSFQLAPSGSTPPGMVRVPSGRFRHPLGTFGVAGPLDISAFWIDRFEVTNRQFKKFLDEGGYQRREYFEFDPPGNGRSVSWDDAIRAFVDATGRAGPSTWSLGTFPKGQEDFPVSGVSWNEAAAYCRAAGKTLPTLFHWSQSAGLQVIDYIVPLSNIGTQSPAEVGSHQGLSPHGSYDMAGNVKEWCVNAAGGQRLILGGAWNEPGYMFGDADARSPWDRSPTNGFRCALYDSAETVPATLTGSVRREIRDYSQEQPASSESFRVYRGLFSYDRSELNAKIESVDESSEYWIREKITYDAAYGNERIPAYLFRPRSVAPPYQAIVYFPGASAENIASSANLNGLGQIEPVVRSGRAVLYPVYQGTYERLVREGSRAPTYLSLDAPVLAGPIAYRDKVIMVAKDLFRSIDYLATRGDVRHDRLAYMGNSLGARMGPIFLALENRFKTAVFLSGGLHLLPKRLRAPEVDEFNYVSHVNLPLLMLNGRNDFLYLLEKSQLPLFNRVGTPQHEKRHVLFDRGHSTPILSNEETREILNWLDRYLGTVK